MKICFILYKNQLVPNLFRVPYGNLNSAPGLKSDSTLVRSVAEFGILVGRCDSTLGRNTLLCCSHFGWKFDDIVCGSIDLSNGSLLRRHHKLVNSCDCYTVQFLSEIINVRDEVFSLDFSDGLHCHVKS